MEGEEEHRLGHFRSRHIEDEDRSFQEVKRNDRKKRRQRPSGNSTSSSTTSAAALSHQSSGDIGSNASIVCSRYHHRQVPPRFQHNKQSSGPEHSSKTNQALNKKTVKESNRWSQLQQSVPSTSTLHPFSSGSNKADDGGWSMGTPEKGSGWGSVTTTRTNCDSWCNIVANESSGAVAITERDRSTSSEQTMFSNMWPSGNDGGSDAQTYQTSELVWTKDNEGEESRSHSPGGLIMIASSRGDNGTFNVQDDMKTSNWRDPKPKTMAGNSWKMPSKDSTAASDWDDTELSFGENTQYPTASYGNHALNADHSQIQLEFDSSSPDKYDPTFVGEMSHSRAETPNSRSSGGATPTQETGGRTSAGSTSSVNSIGSGSSWKSDGKGGKVYTNRLCSPRKPNRYDRSNSLSGIISDKDGNGLYKVRKPKKSLAELEGGLGSLYCEPSGWGELPSPKLCDVDNGTELWGVPPVDQNRLVDKVAETKKGSLNGPDTVSQVTPTSSIEWRDEDSSGTMAAGWNKDDGSKILAPNTPSIPLSHWGPIDESGWGSKIQNDVPPCCDNQDTAGDTTSPQDDYLKTNVDPESVESVGEGSSDIVTNKKLGKRNSPESGHGNSKNTSITKQISSSTASGPIQNQFLFLKLLQGSNRQQMLTQQLGQLQLQKQQLLQQLAQLNRPTASGMTTTVQQKLAAINHTIAQVNQQLMILCQLSSQQKEVGTSSETSITSVSSPKTVHNSPLPMRVKGDSKPNSSFSRSQSASAMIGLGVEPPRSLTYGLQGLSLNSPGQHSVSPSSVRSMSRLQQIISGSSSDNLARFPGGGDGTFQYSLPMTVSSRNGSFPASLPYQKSSPFSPPEGGSLSLHASNDSHSFSFGGASATFNTKKSVGDIQEFRPGIPWQPKSQPTDPAQVYCKQSSVPAGSYHDGNTFSPQSGHQQLSFGSNIPLMRSQSTSGSCYNSVAAHTQHYGQGSGYEKQLNLRIGRQTPVYGHHPKPPTPSPDVINLGLGWKPKGRTIIPPSSLYPSQDFQHKPGYGTRKHQRVAGTPQSQHNTGAHQKVWDSSFSTDDSSGSSSMISNTVWRPDTESLPTSKHSCRQGWNGGFISGGRTWVDATSNQHQHNPPSSFTSPPSHSSISPADCYAPTSTDSLTSGKSTWSQDGVKHGILGSEPTFAEWQAGKRAQLSVNKFASNQPSQWLIVRHLNSQFNEDTLEQISKHGAVQQWIVCSALECSLLLCQSSEDSIRIKEYIGTNSDMVRSGVVIEFASKADVDRVIKQIPEVSPSSQISESTSSSVEAPPPPSKDCNLSSSASPSTPFSRVLSSSCWDSSSSNASSLGRQSSETSPGSSVWSDSGFLSGLSSPWHGSLPVPGAPLPSTTSPQGNRGESVPTSSNPLMSPFLPNGLF